MCSYEKQPCKLLDYVLNPCSQFYSFISKNSLHHPCMLYKQHCNSFTPHIIRRILKQCTTVYNSFYVGNSRLNAWCCQSDNTNDQHTMYNTVRIHRNIEIVGSEIPKAFIRIVEFSLLKMYVASNSVLNQEAECMTSTVYV